MVRVRFSGPSSSQWRALKTSGDMQTAMEKSAESALEHAQSIAPVVSGEYRDSFVVEGTIEGDRAVAHLVNDAAYAAEVEWGQQRHVLSQTADWLEGGA